MYCRKMIGKDDCNNKNVQQLMIIKLINTVRCGILLVRKLCGFLTKIKLSRNVAYYVLTNNTVVKQCQQFLAFAPGGVLL